MCPETVYTLSGMEVVCFSVSLRKRFGLLEPHVAATFTLSCGMTST